MTDVVETGKALDESAKNLTIIANMIDLGAETIMQISPDYIDVGNDWAAKRDMAEAIGANILTAIVKQAGVL